MNCRDGYALPIWIVGMGMLGLYIEWIVSKDTQDKYENKTLQILF